MNAVQIAETTLRMVAAYDVPTPDSVDFSAPAATPADHRARLEAQKLHALVSDETLPDVDRWDALARLSEEMCKALPAMFPSRTAVTYAALRGLLEGLSMHALSEHVRLKRESSPESTIHQQ